MKSKLSYQIFLALLVLALTQFACNISGQSPTAIPQPTVPSSSQATQPPISQPTVPSSPQATQLPTSQPTVPSSPQATSTASGHGTPEEAKAMLQKAVEHYKSVGRAQALSDFTNRVSPFFDRDLYVACIDSKLIQSANGGYPKLVGSAVEPLSRTAWDSASENKIDFVNYQWLDPATGTTEPKTFYYEKVGSDVCGVGAYHPNS